MLPACLTAYRNMDSDFPYNLEIHQVRQSFPLHSHSFIEFSCVIRGSGTQVINGRANAMVPGTFTLILPFQVHEIILQPGEGFDAYNCNISLEAFFDAGETSRDLNRIILNSDERLSEVLLLSAGQSQRIDAIFEELCWEYAHEATWKRLLFRTKLTELLLLFDRFRRESGAGVDVGSGTGADASSATGTDAGTDRVRPTAAPAATPRDNRGQQPDSIWDVLRFVYAHHRGDLHPRTVAEHFHWSVSYLNSRFKQITGRSLHTFLQEMRIQSACGLLISTDLPIAEIARESGYESYVTFFRFFRIFKGLSPRQYRRHNSRKRLLPPV